MYCRATTTCATALPFTGMALHMTWLILGGVMLLVVGASLRRLVTS
jgi:hypothetical protein